MLSCKLLGSRANRSTMVSVSDDKLHNDDEDDFGGSNVPLVTGGKEKEMTSMPS
jgi:hypothetical protein